MSLSSGALVVLELLSLHHCVTCLLYQELCNTLYFWVFRLKTHSHTVSNYRGMNCCQKAMCYILREIVTIISRNKSLPALDEGVGKSSCQQRK